MHILDIEAGIKPALISNFDMSEFEDLETIEAQRKLSEQIVDLLTGFAKPLWITVSPTALTVLQLGECDNLKLSKGPDHVPDLSFCRIAGKFADVNLIVDNYRTDNTPIDIMGFDANMDLIHYQIDINSDKLRFI